MPIVTPLGSANPPPHGQTVALQPLNHHHGSTLPVNCMMLVCGKAVLFIRAATCMSSAAKSQDVVAAICPATHGQSAWGQQEQVGKRVRQVSDVFGGSGEGPTTVVRLLLGQP